MPSWRHRGGQDTRGKICANWRPTHLQLVKNMSLRLAPLGNGPKKWCVGGVVDGRYFGWLLNRNFGDEELRRSLHYVYEGPAPEDAAQPVEHAQPTNARDLLLDLTIRLREASKQQGRRPTLGLPAGGALPPGELGEACLAPLLQWAAVCVSVVFISSKRMLRAQVWCMQPIAHGVHALGAVANCGVPGCLQST